MNPARLMHHLRALTASERRDLLLAATLLPMFWLGLRWLGLVRFRARLTSTSSTATARINSENIHRLAEIVNAAARRSPFPATCLTRSLLLEWFLRRRGIPAELRIGVQRQGAGLAAHAWVEYGGVPVNDRLDIASAFAPFAELAPASSLHFP